MDTVELINKVFSNDLVLLNLFKVAPLTQLKTLRLVCIRWRDLAELEFKKRSMMTLDFSPGGYTPAVALQMFNEIERYSKFPRDSFFFKAPIPWTDPTLLQFLREYGKGIKVLRFEINFQEGHSSKDMQPLRKIVSKYLPNVENLSLGCNNVRKGKNETYNPKTGETGTSNEVSQRRPLRIRFVMGQTQLSTVECQADDRVLRLTQTEMQLWETFHHFISHPVPLVRLTIPDSFCFFYYRFRLDTFKHLKSLTIKASGHAMFKSKDLMAMSAMDLQLNSLSMESLNPKQFNAFLEFLDTQKNCLKKLTVEWLPAMDSKTWEEKVVQFPRMKCLEALEFHCRDETFGGTSPTDDRDWINQFPALTTFKCGFSLGCPDPVNIALEFDENPVFVNINESVSSTVVHQEKSIDWDNYSRMTMEDLDKYYRVSKIKFPNLEKIKIIEQEQGTNKKAVYYYTGNSEDSYFYLSQE